jgi:uncharacterized membrane protein YbhN (UPF0104 family)
VSGTTIHLACLALVAVDFVTRTWRTQLFLWRLGHPLPFREVLVQSAIGETASSLTPLRAGGEPARVWAMAKQGVPARVGLVAVGVELLATSAVIVLTAIVLGVTVAPDWWAATGPGLIRAAAGSWPWLAGIAVVSLGAWLAVRRRRPDLLHAAGGELAAARGHLRDVSGWLYVVNVPITLVSIAARVAILPLLTRALEQQPPLAATVVGSFALLYAQAVIPTPAGAGAVELGFLGGAAGNLGAAEAELLVVWRLYTTVLGTALGLALGAWRFHVDVLSFVLRRPARARAADAPGGGE